MAINMNINLTLNSNAPTPIPAAAPDPESPMKCSLPILLANKEKPTYINKNTNFTIIQTGE